MRRPTWLKRPPEGEWKLSDPRRNARLVDPWTVGHVVLGAGFALLFGPFVAFALLAVYEPIELFIISPILWKLGVEFGYESWWNALSDLVFDAVGVLLAWWLILPRWNPLGV